MAAATTYRRRHRRHRGAGGRHHLTAAIPIFTLGGAVARVEDDATAFTGRAAAHDINFVASWLPDDPEPERHKAWARAAWEAMRPFAHGVYVNFMSDEPTQHVQVAYGGHTYARLAALKNTYDPSNVFRFNQNIAPSQAERSDSYALTTDRWRTGAGSRSAASSS